MIRLSVFLLLATSTLCQALQTGSYSEAATTAPTAVERGHLGLFVRNNRIGDDFASPPAPGILVVKVAPDGPAASVGLLPGDVITHLNGKRLQFSSDPEALLTLSGFVVGERVTLSVHREGKTQPLIFEVVAGERPSELDRQNRHRMRLIQHQENMDLLAQWSALYGKILIERATEQSFTLRSGPHSQAADGGMLESLQSLKPLESFFASDERSLIRFVVVATGPHSWRVNIIDFKAKSK